MPNAKQRKEASDSKEARMFAAGKSMTEIIRVTGTNYTRVHTILVTAGLVNEPSE